jgi:hypothetical protein
MLMAGTSRRQADLAVTTASGAVRFVPLNSLRMMDVVADDVPRLVQFDTVRRGQHGRAVLRFRSGRQRRPRGGAPQLQVPLAARPRFEPATVDL